MRRVAVGATDIIAPVLAAPVVVVLLAARVARQAGVGNLFRAFVLEGVNLGLVAARLYSPRRECVEAMRRKN